MPDETPPDTRKNRRYSNKQVCEALDDSRGMIRLAAKSLGCAPSTLTRRAESEPAIKQKIADLRELELDKSEVALFEARDRGEGWAIKFHLATIGKNRGYVERIESTGKDGEPIAMIFDIEQILGSEAFKEYDRKVRAALAGQSGDVRS
ncbi:MAG: hypothetical protein WC683_19980 [bacterium]|jgi:hypothetical protein